MKSKSTDQAKKSYFNIYSTMKGYIIEIYWRNGNEPKEGNNNKPLTVKFVALYGESTSPKRKHFFLDIYDSELKEDFLAFSQQYKTGEDKLFASISVSEGDVLPFVIEKGESQGQFGLNHFGVLMDITSLTVNGSLIFKSEKSDTLMAVGDNQ